MDNKLNNIMSNEQLPNNTFKQKNYPANYII